METQPLPQAMDPLFERDNAYLSQTPELACFIRPTTSVEQQFYTETERADADTRPVFGHVLVARGGRIPCYFPLTHGMLVWVSRLLHVVLADFEYSWAPELTLAHEEQEQTARDTPPRHT